MRSRNHPGYPRDYHNTHYKVRTERGLASTWTCAECDDVAAEWAFIHDTDPADVMNYRPLCCRCHRLYDGSVPRKFSPAQVLEIRDLLTAKVSQRDIAAQFGVGQMTISSIQTGRTWRWLK